MEIKNIEKTSNDLEVKLQLLELLKPQDPRYNEVLQQANELANILKTALDFN